MSYSFSVTIAKGGDVQATVEDAADEYREENQPEDHAGEQLAAACGTAIALITSGVYGDPDAHEFVVAITGHANPNHEPAPGWGNDFGQVSVYQR